MQLQGSFADDRTNGDPVRTAGKLCSPAAIGLRSCAVLLVEISRPPVRFQLLNHLLWKSKDEKELATGERLAPVLRYRPTKELRKPLKTSSDNHHSTPLRSRLCQSYSSEPIPVRKH